MTRICFAGWQQQSDVTRHYNIMFGQVSQMAALGVEFVISDCILLILS